MGYKRQSPQPVVEGGTGIQSATAYAPLTGGTTSTGPFQSASTGQASAGFVLTSNGSSSLPSFQANLGGGTTGTFTPVLYFGSSSGSDITYLVQAGEYYTIGNIVFFSINISLSSKGASSGNANVSGLPINFGGPVSVGINVAIYYGNITFSASYTDPFVQGTRSNILTLNQMGSGQAGTTLTNSNFANNTNFWINGLYFTS